MMTEDTTQFIAFLGDGDGIADARIISGGTSLEIVPNVNMSKWDDEAFLNINKKDFIVSKSTLTDFIDGRLILQNSNEKWQTYIKDGKQEIEVVYPDAASVPSLIELDLLYTNGLEFFYQSALSPERIENGDFRPDNVVGSYAVYWRKQNNKYKTGKFCHIYAMYFIDAKGSVVKVPYLIENCKIQILPKECAEVSKWLETAYGAITLDPIIGHSSQGASENGVSSGKPEAGKFNSGSNQGDGSVASINIIAKETGGGANASAYCAIYDDNGGEPDTQLTNSYDGVEITGGDSFAAYTITYGTQPTGIAGSTDYWLSVCKGAAGTMQIAFDDGAGTSRHIYNNTDGCDRAVWTTSLDSAGDDKMSIWIVTDEASGGETISIEASVSGVTITLAMDLTVSRALGAGISGNSITSNAGLIVNRSIKGNIQGLIGVSDVELLISEIISIAASILVRIITPEIDLRVARGYVSGISAQTITPTVGLTVNRPITGDIAGQTTASAIDLIVADVLNIIGSITGQAITPDIGLAVKRDVSAGINGAATTSKAVFKVARQFQAGIDITTLTSLISLIREYLETPLHPVLESSTVERIIEGKTLRRLLETNTVERIIERKLNN